MIQRPTCLGALNLLSRRGACVETTCPCIPTSPLEKPATLQNAPPSAVRRPPPAQRSCCQRTPPVASDRMRCVLRARPRNAHHFPALGEVSAPSEY